MVANWCVNAEPIRRDLSEYLAKFLGDTLAPHRQLEPPEEIRTLTREIRGNWEATRTEEATARGRHGAVMQR